VVGGNFEVVGVGLDGGEGGCGRYLNLSLVSRFLHHLFVDVYLGVDGLDVEGVEDWIGRNGLVPLKRRMVEVENTLGEDGGWESEGCYVNSDFGDFQAAGDCMDLYQVLRLQI